MQISKRAIVASLTAAALALLAPVMGTVAQPASARDLEEAVQGSGHLPQVRRFVDLHEELDSLLARYARLEAHAGRAWLDLMQAERVVEGAEIRFDQRVRTAYQFGPGGTLDALLGAASLAEMAMITEYAARTISIDVSVLHDAVVAEAVLVAARARSEAMRSDLQRRIERLRGLLETMERKVDRAAELAVEAHLERELEEQRLAIAELAARQGSWDLGVIGYGQDQTHLLSLLGPTGGRTCDTPDGLVETGKGFSGYASWYGWEFGGRPTATGAIFDPRLFTAANRWLPFGTFLRVRYAGRCAIVLVNDRGPFGHQERVIDLSMASAQYLGVGVSWVDVEILLPAEGLPDR